MELNVNIDHVATIREARGGFEPAPYIAAKIAQEAGATGIVVHLREDRRHIQDRDLQEVRNVIDVKFDLEMAANDEIIKIALDFVPELVTIVPEKRMELTTEGGLNVAAYKERFLRLTNQMHSKNIEVSYFIEPSFEQIDACKEIGADMVELHTGNYSLAKDEESFRNHLDLIHKSADYAHSLGLFVAAGHGLNYTNTQEIAKIKSIRELSIGHSIISSAVFIGLKQAVRNMLSIINQESI